MAIEITDEMRLAVLEELCEEYGHSIGIEHLFHGEGGKTTIKGKDDKLPYAQCLRCRRVWIMVEETPAMSYDAAEAAAIASLAPDSEVRKRVESRRNARKKGQA